MKRFMVSLLIGVVLSVSGCSVLHPRPVMLSPQYQIKIETAIEIIRELERRNTERILDPNDFGLAMTTARETLEAVIEGATQ